VTVAVTVLVTVDTWALPSGDTYPLSPLFCHHPDPLHCSRFALTVATVTCHHPLRGMYGHLPTLQNTSPYHQGRREKKKEVVTVDTSSSPLPGTGFYVSPDVGDKEVTGDTSINHMHTTPDAALPQRALLSLGPSCSTDGEMRPLTQSFSVTKPGGWRLSAVDARPHPRPMRTVLIGAASTDRPRFAAALTP